MISIIISGSGLGNIQRIIKGKLLSRSISRVLSFGLIFQHQKDGHLSSPNVSAWVKQPTRSLF
ncbi:MAG: hypothetical protein VX497_08050, partial [Candidatus Neomarinimicrobiota bacterium]|nr:hypothetical protein [Candidatus Neomarinimicrobiota bacterium]